MLRGKSLLAVGALIVAVGCGGEATKSEAKAPSHPSGHKSATGTSVSKEAADKFEGALQEFADADAKGQWDDATCKSVAQALKQLRMSRGQLLTRHWPRRCTIRAWLISAAEWTKTLAQHSSRPCPPMANSIGRASS